jgi:16S rRNA (guanine527-N7)-methyltransferase
MTNSVFRDRLAARAAHARITLNAVDLRQFEIYFDLLTRWNARMNLTALPLEGAPDPTLDRLFIEPLSASRYFPTSPMDWIDIGSGGGSPAIPLKVVRHQARLTMVESRSRKAAFLREVARTLALQTTGVEAKRFEDLDTDASADLITVRAVRADAALLGSCRRALRTGGALLLFRSDEGPATTSVDGFHVVRVVELVEKRSFLEVLRAT